MGKAWLVSFDKDLDVAIKTNFYLTFKDLFGETQQLRDDMSREILEIDFKTGRWKYTNTTVHDREGFCQDVM